MTVISTEHEIEALLGERLYSNNKFIAFQLSYPFAPDYLPIFLEVFQLRSPPSKYFVLRVRVCNVLLAWECCDFAMPTELVVAIRLVIVQVHTLLRIGQQT